MPEASPAMTAGPAALESILEYLRDDVAAIDRILDQRVSASGQSLIKDLAKHLIGAGGKRLRPVLTLAAARACGYAGERHLPLAAAIEIIHTATLLHDDVVDGSDLRRGLATAHTVWGNKSSVLVGDYLFCLSFQLMVESRSIPILTVLANAMAEVAEGEVLQLSTAHDLETSDERYIQVVNAKTATLFRVATEVGAMIAGASVDTVASFSEYARTLGIAFQLADDALDYDGRLSETGKRVGDDFNEGKATLPALLAYRSGGKEERAFWRRAIAEGNRREGDLKRALSLAEECGAVRRTRALAADYAQRARTAVAGAPDTPLRAALLDLPAYAVHRRS